VFNKAREKRQETIQEQERQQIATIQTTVGEKMNNIPYGDKCDINRTDNFRVYFQNVNGLSVGKHTQWDNILNKMTSKETAVFGLAESNVEWANRQLQARIKAKLRKHYKNTRIATSTSSIKFDTYYKQGGTATIAQKKWSGIASASITDETGKGRWSGLRFKTKH
jgi:hypothetical protein